MSKKVLLIILDGWGIAPDKAVSAIDQAHTPFIDSLYQHYPHNRLQASGLAVGLPEGQMGNSEVGHMNIGAGRVVYQDLVRINRAVEDGSLAHNPVLTDACRQVAQNNKGLHFIGLVSDGGIHSHINHLKAMTAAAARLGVKKLYVHAFTDGRDTDPHSGKGFIRELLAHLEQHGGQLASITGRYYAMDRDKRWERIRLAYDALVHGRGEQTPDVLAAMETSYNRGITDEFIKPIIHTAADGRPVAVIKPGDTVINFNFRTDRGREITQVLTQQDMPEHGMHTLPLRYITLTNYDDTFKGVEVIYDKENLHNTLGEVLAISGKRQIRIAETEKYPHVTFFFSGGREEPFEGEERILCPSPKVATYDLQPEMSARDIAAAIVPRLQSGEPDFICLNFANPDMVGHTGVFEAAVKACETVDACTAEVVGAARSHGYSTLIIADHGNSDVMINPDGTPNTAHTTNPVPVILVDDHYRGNLKPGKLGDLAPTILTLMDLPVPVEMTGEILLG